MVHPATTKYLNRYAESETSNLLDIASVIPAPYRHVLVIPAYKEKADFACRLLQTPWPSGPILAIIVINAPQRADQTTQTGLPETELTLWESLINLGTSQWQSGNLQLIKPHRITYSDNENRVDFLVVDRFSEDHQIPEKQGVGRARKIGADLAVALYAQGLIQDPWIFSSDADAHLSRHYFTLGSQASGTQPISAFVLPYQHTCDDSDIGQATALYESALQYYVQALAWAGSPYAFHTIGSSLCLQADFYCQARGFPKRSGGEDFYLLNKLAKLAPVSSLNTSDFAGEPALTLEARLSDRVPFGTGPSVKKIIELAQNNLPYSYYAPETFIALKQLLQAFHRVDHNFDRAVFLQSLPTYSRAALEESAVNTLFDHIDKLLSEGKQPAFIHRHIHHWFDAFRTLKFIHYLQQHQFPAKPLTEALNKFSALR